MDESSGRNAEVRPEGREQQERRRGGRGAAATDLLRRLADVHVVGPHKHGEAVRFKPAHRLLACT